MGQKDQARRLLKKNDSLLHRVTLTNAFEIEAENVEYKLTPLPSARDDTAQLGNRRLQRRQLGPTESGTIVDTATGGRSSCDKG